VVTILRAERQPVRGWEQGAALLDWGFSLPADASVGRLVNPGELRPTPSGTPAPLVADHQQAAGSGAPVRPMAIAAVTGVVVLFAGVWSGLIVRARRRARSRRRPVG
jgi:D-alanyl-D-alanine carboxypeptidase (penicillin-binding protein 5/6)